MFFYEIKELGVRKKPVGGILIIPERAELEENLIKKKTIRVRTATLHTCHHSECVCVCE